MKKLISIFALLVILSGCASQVNNNMEDFETSEKPPVEQTQTDINSLNSEETMTINQTDLPQSGEKIAIMETSKGTFKIRLFEEQTPKTVENFIGLAEQGYYNGIIFHRVIPDFMIQGGDPTGTGMGGESLWGGKFEDEFNDDLRNIRGALSMANAGSNTNGSQFFIVQAESTPWLDGMHSVFGQVFEGMDVVDAIAAVERDANDKPLEDVIINQIKIETQE